MMIISNERENEEIGNFVVVFPLIIMIISSYLTTNSHWIYLEKCAAWPGLL